MYPYPLERLIAEYKQKYSSVFTFSTKTKEGELVTLARPLSLFEFEHVGTLASRNQVAAKEWVFELCRLATWSVERSATLTEAELPIGLSLVLYDLVMEASSLGSIEAVIGDINYYHSIASSLLMGGAAFIMGAFPQYKFSDVRNLTRQQFTELIVLAELASKQNFTIKTPEELAKDAKKGSSSNLLRKIKDEAKTNDRYINFSQENAELKTKL